MDQEEFAPGWPGIEARWTSSAKTGVGTALGTQSRVWFTLSHGIVNEVYYPRVDLACTRDMELIVTDGADYFSEEKRHTESTCSALEDGVPAFLLSNACRQGRYRIEKEILTDPVRDVLLQRLQFFPLQGTLNDYRIHVLLAPHLGNCGSGNTAWVGDFKGVEMLFAEGHGNALALACSLPWKGRSAGFVGFSDGWQDLFHHKRMTWFYRRAVNGNVALTAEIDFSSGQEAILTLGFGRHWAEAGHRARAALLEDFRKSRRLFVQAWSGWQKSLADRQPAAASKEPRLYRTSAAVLRIHEAKRFAGGTIASLSIPWGFSKGDNDLGGYHLVWPRDLVETAGALLAVGAFADARRVIEFLNITQDADGHWPQNMWMEGSPYWSGIQMDETAFPILLVDLAYRVGALNRAALKRLYPMVQRAAAYLVRNGPVTQQDRWEEDPGYSPFTLAAEIAALLAAADSAEISGDEKAARFLREMADCWNASIEQWIYVSGTDLAAEVGVDGYYVRIAPADRADAASPLQGFVPVKNRPPGSSRMRADHLLSPDALALVRFGLRSPADPRIRNTVKVIDRLLKVQTPSGSLWHRYNGDGYGEHEDGAPFDGVGKGRAWPLLAGERAHFELAAGRKDQARSLLSVMEACANEGGMLSEQVWDDRDIPERELFFGRPSGSAMPLVWAHAEYLKLCRSLADGRVFDMPPQTVKRYLSGSVPDGISLWLFNHKIRSMPAGRTLRIGTLAPALIRWTGDHWKSFQEAATRDTGLGLQVADLPVARLAAGQAICFTFFWPQAERWEGKNFEVKIG